MGTDTPAPTEAEDAALYLEVQARNAMYDPAEPLSCAVYTIGAELVRALGRIEQRIGDPQRVAILEAALREARAQSEKPL